MSVDVDIIKALTINLSNAQAFPVVYENDGSNQSGAYYSCEMLPAETDTLVSLSFADVSDYSGIFQINFYSKKDTGQADYFTGINEIDALFAAGTELVKNDSSVLIESVYPSPSIEIGEWFVTPINVNYRVLA